MPIRSSAAILILAVGVASAQPTDPLAAYFGFDPPRVLAIDDGAGPVAVGDFNADGRPDLAIVNNRKSRIEIHSLRARPRTLEEQELATRANELPPNPWYDRQPIAVPHRVAAVRAFDVDRDGRLDLVYAGSDPQEIVVLRQTEPGRFEEHHRVRAPGIDADGDSFSIADVLGGTEPELISLIDGRPTAWTISREGLLGEPVAVSGSSDVTEVIAGDVNGDGRADLLSWSNAGKTPVRIRLGSPAGLLRERRFAATPLIDADLVTIPGERAHRVATIEPSSRRVTLWSWDAVEALPAAGDGSSQTPVQFEVQPFGGSTEGGRTASIADFDRDGLADLIATDPQGNAIVLHRNDPERGLGDGVSHASYKRPALVAAGQWDGDGPLEVFTLSKEEKSVGVSSIDPDTGAVGFPRAIGLVTPAAEPETMSFLEINGEPRLAVVVSRRRELSIELHAPAGSGVEPEVIELKGVSRAPDAILAADADRDGSPDLLLLAPGRTLAMVRSELTASGARSWTVLTDAEMKQAGLMAGAGPANTLAFDLDRDGSDEIVFADENFVRGCVFDPGEGWRVVTQRNLAPQGVKFVGLAPAGGSDDSGAAGLFLADAEGSRLFELEWAVGDWRVARRSEATGFDLGRLVAGPFLGGGVPGVLTTGESAFAVASLAGPGERLEAESDYRADAEGRFEHELAGGDLNGDGYADLAILDAGEQMCTILSVSASGRLVFATEFKVFESRLFQRGESREYEPSEAVIADLTGDDRDDLLLIVHDRVMIFPQQTR